MKQSALHIRERTKETMDITPTNLKQRTVRGAVALGAAALLVTGATWHGLAAEHSTTALATPTLAGEAQQNPVAASRGPGLRTSRHVERTRSPDAAARSTAPRRSASAGRV